MNTSNDSTPVSPPLATTPSSDPGCNSIIPNEHNESQPATLDSNPGKPQESSVFHQTAFPPFPGETPRAYGAFVAFFQLGATRSLPMLAEKLGECLGTIKNWSSRFDWAGRIQSFNSGLLHQQAQAETELQLKRAADWAKRIDEFREQDWIASRKLLAAARCFLESYGEEELHKMTLAQVSRALDISSRIGRLALNGISSPDQQPAMSAAQTEIALLLKRMYEPPPTVPSATLNAEHREPRHFDVGGQPSTLN